MNKKIRVGAVGLGKLGAAIAKCAQAYDEIELAGVFTRRNKSDIDTYGIAADILPFSDIYSYAGHIDCLIVATGSKQDTEKITPALARSFNVIDSLDNHAALAEHVACVDAEAKAGGHTALVGTGWDPGLLSLLRLYLCAFMPYAAVNTLWGRGVSLGHSEALRSIPGVRYAAEYTEPKQKAEDEARRGKHLTVEKAHRRVCYIVPNAGCEADIIAQIFEPHGYFSDYDTEVHFITEAEFLASHTALPHSGTVIAAGGMGIGSTDRAEAVFKASFTSNPIFTANILLSSVRAVCQLANEGKWGAFTVFDIPPRYFMRGESVL